MPLRLSRHIPAEAKTWAFIYAYFLFFGLIDLGIEIGVVEGRVDQGMSPVDAFVTRLRGHRVAHLVISLLVCYACWKLALWAVKKVKPK